MIASTLAAAPAKAEEPATLLFLGDSIGAGLRIPKGQGWVERAARQLRGRDPAWTLVNASVSGETAKGGLRRLSRLLRRHEPDLVILELGGNDGLRGVHPFHIRKDLEAMVEAARKSGARVAVLGSSLPSNFGRRAVGEFEAMFVEVAKEYGLPHMSLVETEAGRSTRYLQADRIHPNEAAQPLLAEALLEFLAPVLRRIDEGR